MTSIELLERLDTIASTTLATSEDPALVQARTQAQEHKTPFAGSVAPQDVWRLVQAGQATLLDIRTNEERKFVGHVPESLHVAWATGTSMTRNPRFVKEVEAKIKDKQALIFLLCRSGKRSYLAAEALTKAGFSNAFNVSEGFEGDIDEQQRRGGLGGWRFHALPWIQD